MKYLILVMLLCLACNPETRKQRRTLIGPDGYPALDICNFYDAADFCPNGYDVLVIKHECMLIRCKTNNHN